MSIHFNADEILEIAEQIERNGARFYRRAAESTDEPGAKQVLLELAAMEDQHEKLFAGMRGQLGPHEQASTLFDPNDEQARYLQSFADGLIFDVKSDPCEKLTGTESLAEVLQIAIGLEKDSVVFYLGIRDVVPASFGRQRIDEVIREEREHMVMLARQLATCR